MKEYAPDPFRDGKEILFLNDEYDTRIVCYPHTPKKMRYWSKSNDPYLDARNSVSIIGLKQKLKKENFYMRMKWSKTRKNSN